ncbi:hypothetical protein AEAC466_01670 [Asticcacaulis sp. AC466]|uniref:TraB/GumN family protein n=1 Tax=Asticcacaulis sp. AC466 TaxID=1282362 RepID=UPI0003C4106B|nr:TraB/GumN family protein [Asticcacaulis sp. AC466]ESQ85914.1 hypothetical protein AEAC466_01670 [Asticcacaulis sp. AC466]
MQIANLNESQSPKTGQLSWMLDSGLAIVAAVAIVAVIVPAGIWLHRSQNPDVTIKAFAVETDPDVTEAQAGPTGSPLLWVLKEADSTVYLFGAPDAGAVSGAGMTGWMDRRLFTAFDGANRVFFESANYPQSRPGEKVMPGPESVLFHRARHLTIKTEALGSGVGGVSLPAAAWRLGDEKAMTERLMLGAQSNPDAYAALVHRNTLLVPRMESAISAGGVSFVTVGTSHLIGPDGVVKQLRKRGHRLTRLDSVVTVRPAM